MQTKLTTKQKLDLVREFAPYRTEKAWVLDRRDCRRLEQATNIVPPGGWGGLVQLAAGLMLEPTRETFEQAEHPLDGHLIEAFTKYLVPPGAAAAFFLMLGMHPAWGLAIAQDVQCGTHLSRHGSSFQRPFGEEATAAVRDVLFISMAGMLGWMRHLSPDRLVALADLADAMVRCNHFAKESAPHIESDIAVWIDVPDDRQWSERQASYILEEVLVPSGVVVEERDGFRVIHSELEGVDADQFDAELQEWIWSLASSLYPREKGVFDA